jgi:hypothetical protein
MPDLLSGDFEPGSPAAEVLADPDGFARRMDVEADRIARRFLDRELAKRLVATSTTKGDDDA